MFQSYVKLTGSIQVELIPGNDLYIDKKGYSWEIVRYDEKGIEFKFKFEHPKYISVEDPDTMLVRFYNTADYLMPVDEEKLPVPEGYTMTIKLPP